MKKHIYLLGLLVIAGTITLTSCSKKDTTEPETETPTTPGGGGGGSASNAPITPSFADGNGTMIASKVNAIVAVPGTTMVVTTTMGSATASLFDAAGSATLVDGGAITANDSTLAKQSNNAYIFTPKSTGINWGSNSKWSIAGNSSTGVPAFTYTANGFPSNPTLPSITSVSKGSACTFSTSSVSNADSLCFQITSGSKTIYKMKSASQTSHTFSSTEMGTLDVSSNAFMTITAYKFNNTTASTKKYYFINLSTTNRSISVTN